MMIKRVCCIALYLLSIERPKETTVIGNIMIREHPQMTSDLSVCTLLFQINDVSIFTWIFCYLYQAYLFFYGPNICEMPLTLITKGSSNNNMPTALNPTDLYFS